ncbi:MAG: RDD family protein [candidate division Zixibacteria bacterium]|nr:RDD family protein [candidate division Zixibacteria bacterium]
MNAKRDTNTSESIYAGLGRRFAALVIDFIVLSLIFFPVTRLVKGVWVMSSGDHLWGYGWLVTDPLCLVFLVVIFLYFVLLEGFFGATAGKWFTGLKVVDVNGRPPGLRRALVRNVLRVIDALPALNILGVVLILKSPERARFGDRVAGTRVIFKS